MKHYFLQVAEYRPEDFDIGPFDQCLRDRSVRDLVAGHGQLFALIQTDEDLHRLYIGLAWCLHADDHLLVTELPEAEVPASSVNGREWLRAREPFGELIRVKDIIGAREGTVAP